MIESSPLPPGPPAPAEPDGEGAPAAPAGHAGAGEVLATPANGVGSDPGIAADAARAHAGPVGHPGSDPALAAEAAEAAEAGLPMPPADEIREALKEVIDPEIGLNIVDLGLIYEILPREDKTVDVNMTLTSPGCPMGPEITSAVWMTVKRMPGVRECEVNLVWKPRWDPTVHASEEARAYLGIW